MSGAPLESAGGTPGPRPLISFCLFTYRQEHFVREAVAGALAQTYSPLEIMLSDDASPDGSYRLMEELAHHYRGPHQIRLNRNPANLGLVGHVNRLMELARGEIIVIAAGDDISLPERTEETWRLWAASGHRAMSISFIPEPLKRQSDLPWQFIARPEWNTLDHQLCTGEASVCGASQAWHRRVFEVFGPLPADLAEEDRAIAFRAALLGELILAPSPLVRYRIHQHNVSLSALQEAQTRKAAALRLLSRDKPARLRSFLRDVKTAATHGLLTPEQAAAATATLERTLACTQAELALFTGNRKERLAAARQLCQAPPAARPGRGRRLYLRLAALWPAAADAWVRLRMSRWVQRRWPAG